MRCGIGLLAITVVVAAGSALAETPLSEPISQAETTLPGVDVPRPLHPLRPPATTTLRPAPFPGRYGTLTAIAPAAPHQVTGYNLGAFTAYPSVTGARFYDDNVFASSTNRLSDTGY